jgi:hypothetical protein
VKNEELRDQIVNCFEYHANAMAMSEELKTMEEGGEWDRIQEAREKAWEQYNSVLESLRKNVDAVMLELARNKEAWLEEYKDEYYSVFIEWALDASEDLAKAAEPEEGLYENCVSMLKEGEEFYNKGFLKPWEGK